MNKTRFIVDINTPLREHEKAEIKDLIRLMLQLKFTPEVIYISYEKTT